MLNLLLEAHNRHLEESRKQIEARLANARTLLASMLESRASEQALEQQRQVLAQLETELLELTGKLMKLR
jgi:hypothetical protein